MKTPEKIKREIVKVAKIIANGNHSEYAIKDKILILCDLAYEQGYYDAEIKGEGLEPMINLNKIGGW